MMVGYFAKIFALVLVPTSGQVPHSSNLVGKGWCRYSSSSSDLLRVAKVSSAEICEAECKIRAGCTAYSYTQDGTSDCNLYAGGPYTSGSGQANTICYELQADRNLVTEKAEYVGSWGGSCTCPDGGVYWVGAKYAQQATAGKCASLACDGGISGDCHTFAAQWSHRKVECQAIGNASGAEGISTTKPPVTGISTTKPPVTDTPYKLFGASRCCNHMESIRIQSLWQPSADACGQQCASTIHCWGFAFNAALNGYNCHLWDAPCELRQACGFHQYVMRRSLTTTTTSSTTTTTTTTTMDVPDNVCIKLSFDFYVESTSTRCSYDDVVAHMQSILDKLQEKGQACAHDATTELNLHFGVDTARKAQSHMKELCETLKIEEFNWAKVTNRGKDFDKEYFSGVGPWNLEVERIHYGEEVYHLRDDVKRIRDIYGTSAQTMRIGWPGFVDSLANCPLRAVTCCMVADRQANDNNGNCAKPYDKNCVDSVPADNSHVCSVNGSVPKLQVVGGQQSPVHCHSFAWSNQSSEASSVFRGNILFYTSFYDHLSQRGYVKNIPGAPMCGCVETMPVVSRSDCTQVDLEMKFRFTPSREGPRISGPITVELDFNSCRTNWENNDLYFYYKRLVTEGRASVEELVKLRNFVRTRADIWDSSHCGNDNGLDEIQAMLAAGSKDAELLRMAITTYTVEHTPVGMPVGGFHMRKSDVGRLAETYLGQEVGLEGSTLLGYLEDHFDREFFIVTGTHGPFLKLSLLPALMTKLASHYRRLVVV